MIDKIQQLEELARRIKELAISKDEIDMSITVELLKRSEKLMKEIYGNK